MILDRLAVRIFYLTCETQHSKTKYLKKSLALGNSTEKNADQNWIFFSLDNGGCDLDKIFFS